MTDPLEEIKVTTPAGSVAASGTQTPLIAVVIALCVGTVAFNYISDKAIADALVVHNTSMEAAEKERVKSWNTLVGIQCEILRNQYPHAPRPEGCH